MDAVTRKQLAEQGWPERVESELANIQPYEGYQNSLNLYDECLLWGARVIELHKVHPGIIKVEILAHQNMQWPGIDVELEKYKSCHRNCRYKPSPCTASFVVVGLNTTSTVHVLILRRMLLS
jgi:hypothetical protein